MKPDDPRITERQRDLRFHMLKTYLESTRPAGLDQLGSRRARASFHAAAARYCEFASAVEHLLRTLPPIVKGTA